MCEGDCRRAEARGGLHIVEQSLWTAVPAYMRKLSAALTKHCGHGLPLDRTPLTFASWMGGDRDGNPNVTARTTHDVALLARWMASDLFLREVEGLRFEARPPRRRRKGNPPPPPLPQPRVSRHPQEPLLKTQAGACAREGGARPMQPPHPSRPSNIGASARGWWGDLQRKQVPGQGGGGGQRIARGTGGGGEAHAASCTGQR